MALSLLLYEEATLPPAVDARIRAALAAGFPADAAVFSQTRAWHGSAPAWTLLMETPHGEIAAHLGVVERRVRFGDAELRVGGLQNVLVAAAWRGQGLAQQLLAAAEAGMRQRGYDGGLLFCTPGLVPLYARSGWEPLPERAAVRVDAEGREHRLDPKNGVMWLPLKGAAAPPGPLHLQGNDW